MKPFTTHTGEMVPLRRDSVDTDQIIPSDWLKRVERTGYGEGLFSQWRADPDFVLNDPRFAGGSILVTGPAFGCGSSREHAVWALDDYGFRVVIAPSFADIFRSNALQAGLLPVELPAHVVEALTDAAPGPATVDLVDRRVRCGKIDEPFAFNDDARDRFLAGLDDVSITLRASDAITAFEARRSNWLPTT